MIRNIVKSSFLTLALFGAFAVSQGATAAELVKLEGKVTVNRGDGFEPATQGMVLKVGDQVFVGEKSAASLVYANPGCVFEAAPASVVTISDVGPCIPGQTVMQGKSALVIPTQDSTQDNNNACDTSDDGHNECLPFFVMGGAAVIGTIAAFATVSGNDEGTGRNGSGGGIIGGGGPTSP